jgi:hypothetical protein
MRSKKFDEGNTRFRLENLVFRGQQERYRSVDTIQLVLSLDIEMRESAKKKWFRQFSTPTLCAIFSQNRSFFDLLSLIARPRTQNGTFLCLFCLSMILQRSYSVIPRRMDVTVRPFWLAEQKTSAQNAPGAA